VKLVRYIGIQLQCKLSVPLNDRTVELNSYPRLSDWLYLVNLRKDVIQSGLKGIGMKRVLEKSVGMHTSIRCKPVDYNLKYLLTPQIPERLVFPRPMFSKQLLVSGANDWLSDPLVWGRDCSLNNGVFMELGHWESSCEHEGHSARHAAECERPSLPRFCGS
ncbi:hypothetical protein Chor_005905, partial [Crotalus horridus]